MQYMREQRFHTIPSLLIVPDTEVCRGGEVNQGQMNLSIGASVSRFNLFSTIPFVLLACSMLTSFSGHLYMHEQSFRLTCLTSNLEGLSFDSQ